jgi:hypothetical protein
MQNRAMRASSLSSCNLGRNQRCQRQCINPERRPGLFGLQESLLRTIVSQTTKRVWLRILT